MTIDERRIIRYCERHSSQSSTLRTTVDRHTGVQTLAPQMMSGHIQGNLLSLLSRLKRPRRILEIGTFTGYATLCLAEGLPQDGMLHTIEGHPIYEHIFRPAFGQSPHAHQIKIHIGQAEDVIPTLEESWDIVFLDGAKKQYLEHYHLIIDHVAPGGIILADNVLWSGDVIRPSKTKETRAIKAFNDFIKNDQRVQQTLLPLRDGLFIIEKI